MSPFAVTVLWLSTALAQLQIVATVARGGGGGGDDACSWHCHCGPLAADRGPHNWLVSESAYRLQSLLIGRGKNLHRPQQPQTGLRHMTCIGLTEMPSAVPPDIKKLVIYGDSYGPMTKQRQRDEPGRGYVDWDESLAIGDHKERQQISAINPAALAMAVQLEEVFLEGNNITKIRRGDFHRASRVRLLSFRGNNLEEIESYSLQGLQILESADFSMNRLKTIGKHAFSHTPQLRKLSLAENCIGRLHGFQLYGLHQLSSLDLSRNALQYLDAATFEPLRKLTELDLSSNRMTGSVEPWFKNTMLLQVLRMAKNGFTAIAAGAFASLVELRELDLSQNNLTSIASDTFAHLYGLEVLDIADNAIQFVAAGAFLRQSKLHTLRLSRNEIAILGAQTLLGLGHLQVLHLEGNKIDKLRNEALRAVTNLRHLHMSHNLVAALPRRVFSGLLELREINLNDNRIQQIEDEAFAAGSAPTAMSKLTWLRLQNNLLSAIGAYAFHGLPFLRHLDLSANSLRHVDKLTLRPAGNLLTLSLACNELTSLQPLTFAKQRVLRTLAINGNGITSLGLEALSGLVSLEELDASSNELDTIADGALADLNQLTRLDLSLNRLTSIDLGRAGLLGQSNLLHLDVSKNKLEKAAILPASASAFGKRLQLKSLDLSDNALEYLAEATADAVARGGELRLHGNPWTCDCLMSWLPKLGRIRPTLLTLSAQVTCKVPSWLTGTSIMSLSDAQFACYPETQLTREKSAILCKESPEHLLATTSSLKQTRSRKELISNSVAIIRTADGMPVCGGIRVSADWLLAPSSCWQPATGTPNSTEVVAVFGAARRRGSLSNATATATLLYAVRSPHTGADFGREGQGGRDSDKRKNDLMLIRVRWDSRAAHAKIPYTSPCVLDKDQLAAVLARRATGRTLGRKLDRFRVDIEPVAVKMRAGVCSREHGEGADDAPYHGCARTLHRITHNLDMEGAGLYYDLQAHWAVAAVHTQQEAHERSQVSPVSERHPGMQQLQYEPLWVYAEWIDNTIRQSGDELRDRKKRH